MVGVSERQRSNSAVEPASHDWHCSGSAIWIADENLAPPLHWRAGLLATLIRCTRGSDVKGTLSITLLPSSCTSMSSVITDSSTRFRISLSESFRRRSFANWERPSNELIPASEQFKISKPSAVYISKSSMACSIQLAKALSLTRYSVRSLCGE